MSTSDPGARTAAGVGSGRRPAPDGEPGSGAAQGAKDQVQDKAQQAVGQAKDQAQQAAGQGKQRALEVVDQRSTQAGEQVNQQASDIRTVGQKLREEGKEGPAKIADQAADRAERLGGYLQHSNADTIIQDLEDLGRKQPMAVIAGGIALGFAASRFLKASSSQRYQQRSSGVTRPRPSYTPPGGEIAPRSTSQSGPSVAVEDRPTPATGVGATQLPPATPGTRGR